jgi:phage terminase small subunit
MDKKLTPKQERFIQEYLVDLNATKAAARAGYSERTASEQSARLLGDVRIQAALREAMDNLAQRTETTQERVISQLWENVSIALATTPPQVAAANQALGLIGKHFGMFADRIEVKKDVTIRDERLAEYSLDELRAFILAERAKQSAIEGEHGPMLPAGET